MQIFPTAVCNFTAWRHLRLRAHWLKALVGGWGRSMYSAFPVNCSVSYLSFVYGRSLTAGKVLFTGRQTCSLYLVLWLCVEMIFSCMAQLASNALGHPHIVSSFITALWPAIVVSFFHPWKAWYRPKQSLYSVYAIFFVLLMFCCFRKILTRVVWTRCIPGRDTYFSWKKVSQRCLLLNILAILIYINISTIYRLFEPTYWMYKPLMSI